MRKAILVLALMLASLITASSAEAASAVHRVPTVCTHALAPRLCAIHTHYGRTRSLHLKMGLPVAPYGYAAERHPAKRDAILTQWTHVNQRSYRRYVAWKKATTVHSSNANVALGSRLAARYGWGSGTQFSCLYALWNRESGWVTQKANYAGSGAYGIPQAYPGYKMGAGWQTNATVQINWGLGYIKARYKTPCAADAFQAANGWY